MTNDEKLALLDKWEEVYWESLQRWEPVRHVKSFDLESIERCQRIRAELKPKHRIVAGGKVAHECDDADNCEYRIKFAVTNRANPEVYSPVRATESLNN